ncbi:MAG: S1 RNA-binding domain-containing protein [Acidobacteriota bacterium]
MSPPGDEEGQDFGAILAEFERSQKGTGKKAKGPQRGDKVTGTLLSIGRESAFVELGGKSEAIVALEELFDEDGALDYAEGDEVTGTITGVDDSGCFVLKVKAGRIRGGEAALEELRQAAQGGLTVIGRVDERNKGGVEVEVAGQRAFCPISQLDVRFVEDPSEYIGRSLEFKITKFEDSGRGRPNIVLSRRALLAEAAAAKAEETRAKLAVGAVLDGTVTSLTSYGAFVDLGGLEGLLHISQISHRRLEHPKEELTVGQQLQVEVLKIEPGKDGKGERISLSRRSLEADPWDDAGDRFLPGAIQSGIVLRLESFGAFVEIAPGLTGLLHVSELGSGRRLSHAREVLELGQSVEVRVLSVDSERRRIALTLDGGPGHDGGADEADSASLPRSTGGLGSLGDFFGDRKDD